MRILYSPKKLVARCKNCGTTLEFANAREWQLFCRQAYEPKEDVVDAVWESNDDFVPDVFPDLPLSKDGEHEEYIMCPGCRELIKDDVVDDGDLLYELVVGNKKLVSESGTCAYCGTDYAEDDKYCPKCGAPIKRGKK